MNNEKEIIDLTPTWSQVLNALLMVLEAGDKEGKKTAINELKNMAKAADISVEVSKILESDANPSDAYDQIFYLIKPS